MRRAAAAALVACLCVVGMSTPAGAKKAPIPTLRSPAGHLYRAGEFCPEKDLGLLDHGSDGLIKCVDDAGYDRWLKA